MVEIKYNTPIKVSKAQMLRVANELNGVCAYRTDSDGNHWVSQWYANSYYKFKLNEIINGSN